MEGHILTFFCVDIWMDFSCNNLDGNVFTCIFNKLHHILSYSLLEMKLWIICLIFSYCWRKSETNVGIQTIHPMDKQWSESLLVNCCGTLIIDINTNKLVIRMVCWISCTCSRMYADFCTFINLLNCRLNLYIELDRTLFYWLWCVKFFDNLWSKMGGGDKP